MTLDELLNKTGDLSFHDYHKYIQAKGLDNISTEDFNLLIKRYGSEILMMPGFNEYYSIVSSNESNRVMIKWTKAIGIMTVIVVLATVLMLLKG